MEQARCPVCARLPASEVPVAVLVYSGGCCGGSLGTQELEE